MSYNVRSWHLPQSKRGTSPVGYVSMLIDDRADALSRAREWSRGRLGRRVEITDSWSGETRRYTILPDGAIKEG